MIHFKSNRKLRFSRFLAFILILAVGLSSFTIYIDFRLRNIAKTFAKSAAKTALINATNIACERLMKKSNVSYADLSIISRNEAGMATSVEINSVLTNSLKAELTNAIADELSSLATITVTVPLSAAFGIYYSVFESPKFEYKVHITTTVFTNLKSAFKGAGINQVLHQILLDVSLESDLAMQEGNTETLTSTTFLIAETVIVGVVPDAFTEVVNAPDEVAEDIFDFGADTTY